MSIAILKFFSIDRKVEDRGFALFFEDGTDKVKTEDTFKPLYIYPIFKKYKVENNLKGGLDLIPSPSPSMKIQIIVGKICLRCISKTLLGDVNKLFVFKSLLAMLNNVLPYSLK